MEALIRICLAAFLTLFSGYVLLLSISDFGLSLPFIHAFTHPRVIVSHYNLFLHLLFLFTNSPFFSLLPCLFILPIIVLET